MMSFTEDKSPVPLIPGTELCDVRIGATNPALFFSIAVDTPCQVTFEFQEFNSAARCVLLLSPTDPRPSKHTAVWKCLSPDQNKTMSVLPADPSYQVGTLYLAVRYVETSGNTYIRLRLTLQEQYEAEWYSAANRALYYGRWLGCTYHGRGRCIYGVAPEAAQDGTARWSGRSLPQQSEAVSWQPDFTPLLESGMLDVARKDVGWSILSLPFPSVEVYDGEWVNGKKEGRGVYQWADRAYWGMWRSGKREGFGVMNTRHGLRYEGEWLDDKKHGFGKMFSPDGTRYQGAWEGDVRSGEGVFIYTNGVVIHGTWKDDMLSSKVTANYADGSCYVGQWGHDCRHGEGSFTDTPGNVLKGTWDMDKCTGEGKMTFVNGVVCVATWVNDVRQGGTFTFPNGEVYVGDWNDELYFREGEGRCTYRNGDEYIGHWSGDKRHGFGKMIEAGGKCVYEGEWCKGKRHGLGIQKDDHGVYHGEFRDDVRCGQGLHQGPNGSMYRGNWKDNDRVGPGIGFDAKTGSTYEGLFLLGKLQSVGKSRSDKDAYEGTWMDGRRQGVGTTLLPNGDVVRHTWHQGAPQDGEVLCKYHNGDTYDGEWKDGRRCGKGTQRYANGAIYVGEWANDKPHGRGSLTDARGETLESEWREGVRMDVRGRLHFLDGSVYEGDMCAGRPHGQGRLSYPDGTSFEGAFRDGIYVL
ncbi:hypothetical protein DQ04_05631040 [Trypanosoma grayi]|uniref:hypothetical protein n=1 Tax=Trypanosoma grayi TaxID=71804 RepID=UPI0004F43376|nr:hypothetical protein DQ04_05631040 [Trypanosoma grayi]KEG09199.1 hypothetical protein DQ04_05631040 [Trypanosoma grayi]